MKQSWKFLAAWFSLLLVVLLGLGSLFRLGNLDRKYYWQDETITSLRVSGYTYAEVKQDAFDGRTITAEQLQTYQRLKPGSGMQDVLHSLAIEDSQHPPLYYVLTRFAVEWFGSSVATTRAVAALLSLLVFPCVYWLCWELFQSPQVGWMAIALLAISPMHILYAQEAREYSLWTATTLLCSAALLRAMRVKTWQGWAVYCLTLATSFYTFLFTALVAIGHGLYVLILERFRLKKPVISYGLSSLIAILLFAPWAIIVASSIAQIQETNEWSGAEAGLPYLIKRWTANFIQIFLTWNFQDDFQLIELIALAGLALVLLIFVAYSFYFLYRHTPTQSWLFVITLTGATSLILVIPDLILGGYRSGINRYQIPACLGIQLSIAFLLAKQVLLPASSTRWQTIYKLVFALLVSVGVFSTALMFPLETWWTKGATSYDNLAIAPIINASKQPLVLLGTDSSIGDALPLSYLLKPTVALRQTLEDQKLTPSTNFTDIFLFDNASNVPYLKEYEKSQNLTFDALFEGQQKWLWRVSPEKNE